MCMSCSVREIVGAGSKCMPGLDTQRRTKDMAVIPQFFISQNYLLRWHTGCPYPKRDVAALPMEAENRLFRRTQYWSEVISL